MAQKRPKINPTIRHLLKSPILYESVPRLDLFVTPVVHTINYYEFDDLLAELCDANTLFFPDTSFLNGPELPEFIWDQILGRRLVITPFIWRETIEWRGNPYRNQRVAEAIHQAEKGAQNHVYADHLLGIDQYQHRGRVYYVTLLGYRKSRVRDLVQQFMRDNGRQPDEAELDRLIKKNGQPQDAVLLGKGFDELHRGAHFFSDEDLVVTAGIGGLSDACHAVILTRDKDVLEQAGKFFNLLTIQYFGLLFGERYASNPDDFAKVPLPLGVPTIDAYFQADGGFLVRKPVHDPNDFVGWLLPIAFERVKITCLLLGGNDPALKLSMMIYNAERDMHRLIATKGKTRGLNTDRLDGKNCHVTGYPEGIPDPRNHVVIARDRTRGTDGNDPMNFAHLDIAHCINHATILSVPS